MAITFRHPMHIHLAAVLRRSITRPCVDWYQAQAVNVVRHSDSPTVMKVNPVLLVVVRIRNAKILLSDSQG